MAKKKSAKQLKKGKKIQHTKPLTVTRMIDKASPL